MSGGTETNWRPLSFACYSRTWCVPAGTSLPQDHASERIISPSDCVFSVMGAITADYACRTVHEHLSAWMSTSHSVWECL